MGKKDDLPRGCHDFQRSGDGGELILGTGRPFEHLCRDADGNGVGRDVVGDEAEGAHNRIFAYCDARHDDTVASHLAVLFQGHLSRLLINS